MVSPGTFQYEPDEFHQVLIKMQRLSTCQKIKLYVKRKFDHEQKLPSPQVKQEHYAPPPGPPPHPLQWLEKNKMGNLHMCDIKISFLHFKKPKHSISGKNHDN